MHRLAQGARALAVHNAHLEDAKAPALQEVLGEELLQVARVEGVEVQRAVDGDGEGLVRHWNDFGFGNWDLGKK